MVENKREFVLGMCSEVSVSLRFVSQRIKPLVVVGNRFQSAVENFLARPESH